MFLLVTTFTAEADEGSADRLRAWIGGGTATGLADSAQTRFSLWAGAGVQGGRVVGETDRVGAQPITEPITGLLIGTTIVELAGVDAQARSELNVLQGGRVIHELF
jgi:hypothetical protein